MLDRWTDFANEAWQQLHLSDISWHVTRADFHLTSLDNETMKPIVTECNSSLTSKWLEIYTTMCNTETLMLIEMIRCCRYITKNPVLPQRESERERNKMIKKKGPPSYCLDGDTILRCQSTGSTLNQKNREVRVYMTRTCCSERVPLVNTAFAPPSILVRITVTQSPLFFSIGGIPWGVLAVVTMAWERWSKGFDSHWRIQPSIVSLPLLCSRQQPSSALTVKLASLHVDKNSSALLNHNEIAHLKFFHTEKFQLNFNNPLKYARWYFHGRRVDTN